MTNDIIRKKNTGEPGNGGQFGSQGHDEADASLTPVPVRSASAEFYALGMITHLASVDYQYAALDAAAERLASIPGAATAVFDWVSDDGPGWFNLSEVRGENGEALDITLDDENSLQEIGSTIDDEDAGTDGILTVSAADAGKRTAQIEHLYQLEREMEAAAQAEAWAESKRTRAAVAAMELIARDINPSAQAVILTNMNDEGGSPYFMVTKVEGPAETTLWSHSDEESEDRYEQFANYSPQLDRVMEKLVHISGDEWRFSF